MPAVSVRFGSPRTTVIGFLLVGSLFVVIWKWNSLSWHARGMILAAYGVTLLGVMLIPALRARALLKSGARAQGTVVDMKEHHTSGDATTTSSTAYYPVVRFTTADGRTVEFTSAVGYSSYDEIPGRVSVRYRPDDPEKAEIDRANTWILPAGFGLVGGLGLLVAGVIVYLGNGSGPKAAPQVSAASSPSSEPATAETSAQETPFTPEASSPAQPITDTLPGSIDVTSTGADGDTIQGTVKVAHLGNSQHTTLPYGEDPANGYFVAFVVNESSKGDGFDFGGTLDFYVVVKGVHYDSDNGHVLTGGRADAELLPVTLNAGESTHGTVTFDLPSTHGQLRYSPIDQGTPVAVWAF